MMTEHTTEAVSTFMEGDGPDAYAIPTSVLELSRATPDQRAAIVATMAEDAPEIAADAPLSVLTAEALARYRLSEEQWAAMAANPDEASDDDTGGFQYIGQFPRWTYIWVEPAPGRPSRLCRARVAPGRARQHSTLRRLPTAALSAQRGPRRATGSGWLIITQPSRAAHQHATSNGGAVSLWGTRHFDVGASLRQLPPRTSSFREARRDTVPPE
jgi:hypothetical protein